LVGSHQGGRRASVRSGAFTTCIFSAFAKTTLRLSERYMLINDVVQRGFGTYGGVVSCGEVYMRGLRYSHPPLVMESRD